MKPSFALNLTDDGITLLHRTARGWMDVGSVAFGDPDLGAALDYLRSTALGLSPSGISTKLIIPDSQIRYFRIDAQGPDDDSRRAQIAAALDGLTPYAPEELAFDWHGSGPTVTVAVVARETLAEAEGFATEHRFNPVSFVALPDTGFDAEPFFGVSALAANLLPPGERVDRDAEPVHIIPRDVPRADPLPPPVESVAEPAPEPEPEAVAASDVPAAPPAEPDLPPAEMPPSQPDAPQPEVPQPEVPQPDLPQPDMPGPAVPQPELPEQSPPEPEIPDPQPDLPEIPVPAPEPVREPPAPQPVPDPTPVRPPEPFVPPSLPPAQDPVLPPVIMATTSSALAEEAEAPMAVDVPQDDPEPEPAPAMAKPALAGSVQSTTLDDVPPQPSAAALMAFASRRAAEGATRPLGAAEAIDSGGARPVAPSATRPAAARPLVERPAALRPAPKFSYDDPLPPPPPRMPGDPPVPSALGKATNGLRSLGSLVTSPSIPGTRKKKPMINGSAAAASAAAKPAAAVTPLATPMDATASMRAAAQSLSRPKAAAAPDALGKGLRGRTLPQRGKPRYLGLILTGILLLLLAIVAAWSSLYLTRGEDAPTEVQFAGYDDEALADGQLPGADDEMLADQQDPDDLAIDLDLSMVAAGPAADLPVVSDQTEPAIAALPEAQEPAVPAPDMPAPVVTAGPAPQAAGLDLLTVAIQPATTSQDEIFLAAMDAPPSLSDPLVLPQPAALGDAPPAAQMPPPPFGTVYQFDAEGRILPTAEGIMTPEGVMLVAGKPSVVPPERPAFAAAPAPEAADTAAAVAAALQVATETAPATDEVQPAETFAADPALSSARPRLRPAGLAPEAVAEDDASLAPAEDSRFSSLRPRLRPQAVLAAGEAARRASEAASLAVEAAAVEAAVASATAADANLSPLAVSVSRVPAPRPRDLSRAIDAAVAAATRQPESRRAAPEPEPQQVAAPAPRSAGRAKTVEEEEADDEPEVVAQAAPRIPTKANVAKQATFVNAINLSKINLIGVYGTQSRRYALVRQANGRYRKVSVGDSLDGGKVQAITASEVRYQKGGRMLSLEMPKG
jgi:hypothetical protein